MGALVLVFFLFKDVIYIHQQVFKKFVEMHVLETKNYFVPKSTHLLVLFFHELCKYSCISSKYWELVGHLNVVNGIIIQCILGLINTNPVIQY